MKKQGVLPTSQVRHDREITKEGTIKGIRDRREVSDRGGVMEEL